MFACVTAALSFSLPSGEAPTRRDILAKVAVAPLAALATLQLPASAHAVSARTGQSSLFTGEYDDPKHPGCLRSIKVVGAKVGPDGRKQRQPTAYVKGTDGGESRTCKGPPVLSDVWSLEGKVAEDGSEIYIDFSPKGGPKGLVGTYDTFGGVPGIQFPDGNKWTKVANGTPERRPPAITLNTGD